MAEKKPRFRFFSDISELPKETTDFIWKNTKGIEFLEEFFTDGHGRGILRGNELVALVWHSTSKGNCKINHMGTLSNKHLRDFAREFGIAPSRYLMESFIRQGIKFFIYESTLPQGRALHKGLLREGLVKLVYHKKAKDLSKSSLDILQGVKEEEGVLKVTNKWINLAKSRKRTIQRFFHLGRPVRRITRSRKKFLRNARRRLL